MNSVAYGTAKTKSWALYRAQTWRQLGKDLGYILPGWFISITSFSFIVPLFFTGVGTIIIWIGIPIIIFTLYTARVIATFERMRLQFWYKTVPKAIYKKSQVFSIKNLLRGLSDKQMWCDLIAITLVNFPIRVITFPITLSLIIVAPTLLLTPLFKILSGYIPAISPNIDDIVIGHESLQNTPIIYVAIFMVGLGLLALLPFITYFFAWIDAASSRLLFTSERSHIFNSQENGNTSATASSFVAGGSYGEIVDAQKELDLSIEQCEINIHQANAALLRAREVSEKLKNGSGNSSGA